MPKKEATRITTRVGVRSARNYGRALSEAFRKSGKLRASQRREQTLSGERFLCDVVRLSVNFSSCAER